ncbi:hypothetical protein EV126DRAFT_224998 [Verticillium dahliae]|nr:hypothetical protein EV126DRAFT_224998 [Verticillium dahliae]
MRAWCPRPRCQSCAHWSQSAPAPALLHRGADLSSLVVSRLSPLALSACLPLHHRPPLRPPPLPPFSPTPRGSNLLVPLVPYFGLILPVLDPSLSSISLLGCGCLVLRLSNRSIRVLFSIVFAYQYSASPSPACLAARLASGPAICVSNPFEPRCWWRPLSQPATGTCVRHRYSHTRRAFQPLIGSCVAHLRTRHFATFHLVYRIPGAPHSSRPCLLSCRLFFFDLCPCPCPCTVP